MFLGRPFGAIQRHLLGPWGALDRLRGVREAPSELLRGFVLALGALRGVLPDVRIVFADIDKLFSARGGPDRSRGGAGLAFLHRGLGLQSALEGIPGSHRNLAGVLGSSLAVLGSLGALWGALCLFCSVLEHIEKPLVFVLFSGVGISLRVPWAALRCHTASFAGPLGRP